MWLFFLSSQVENKSGERICIRTFPHSKRYPGNFAVFPVGSEDVRANDYMPWVYNFYDMIAQTACVSKAPSKHTVVWAARRHCGEEICQKICTINRWVDKFYQTTSKICVKKIEQRSCFGFGYWDAQKAAFFCTLRGFWWHLHSFTESI